MQKVVGSHFFVLHSAYRCRPPRPSFEHEQGFAFASLLEFFRQWQRGHRAAKARPGYNHCIIPLIAHQATPLIPSLAVAATDASRFLSVNPADGGEHASLGARDHVAHAALPKK